MLRFVPGFATLAHARPAAAIARICGVRGRRLWTHFPPCFLSPPGLPVNDTLFPRFVLKLIRVGAQPRAFRAFFRRAIAISPFSGGDGRAGEAS